jgi:hypothetical protein
MVSLSGLVVHTWVVIVTCVGQCSSLAKQVCDTGPDRGKTPYMLDNECAVIPSWDILTKDAALFDE